MKRPVLSALVTLAVALPATAGAAPQPPTISVTSPANGASFSRANSETIIVTGTSAFGEAIPASRTFYMRRDACGGSVPPNLRLSTTAGTDGGDGCGNLISGVLPGTENYPAENGLPLTVDFARTAKVTVVLSSWSGVTGAGTQQVTATLTGRAGNQQRTLGAGTHSMNVTGVDAYTADITIPLQNPGAPISTLNLALTIGGGVQHGHVNLNGASFVELPILDTGRVDVSSDSATFAPSKTVQADISADGTWTAEITTPSAGNRKIYSRAVQANMTTQATPVSITVTA
jgi:hypothetical protein